MKKGIKRTNAPLLFEVNYPEHGQVGYVVRLNRRGKRVYSIFNYSQFSSKDATKKAAMQYARKLDREFPRLSRQELAMVRGKRIPAFAASSIAPADATMPFGKPVGAQKPIRSNA